MNTPFGTNRVVPGLKRGFTLVELVIVMAVITILCACLSLSPPERKNLEQQARVLQADIRYAQRLAITETKRVRITFNKKDRYYIIEKFGSSGYEPVKIAVMDDYITDLFLNASNAEIAFTERGTTNDACTITVSSSSYTAVLTVNVGSGRVKITEIIKKSRRG